MKKFNVYCNYEKTDLSRLIISAAALSNALHGFVFNATRYVDEDASNSVVGETIGLRMPDISPMRHMQHELERFLEFMSSVSEKHIEVTFVDSGESYVALFTAAEWKIHKQRLASAKSCRTYFDENGISYHKIPVITEFWK